jgi:hypothetical protein
MFDDFEQRGNVTFAVWMLLPSSLALCPIKTTWDIWLSINANKAL